MSDNVAYIYIIQRLDNNAIKVDSQLYLTWEAAWEAAGKEIYGLGDNNIRYSVEIACIFL